METCICPSPSLTIFSFPPFFFLLVTSPVGKYRKGRGRGGCTALSASYTSKQNQPVRQETASCVSQPGLPLIRLSHCRAPLGSVLLPHSSAEVEDFVCSALPLAQGERRERRNSPCAGPLPAIARYSHEADLNVPRPGVSSSFKN